MKHRPSLIAALLTVLLMGAGALWAGGRSDSAGRAWTTISFGDRGVIQRGAGPSGQPPWHGFPISMSLRDAPLPEVLRTFAQLVGFNLVLDPRVDGAVTVELKDVPWDQALSVILKTHGLAAEVDGRIWMVAPQ